jgi:hypothetical protein
MHPEGTRTPESLPPRLRKLVEEGKAIAPRHQMRDVLACLGRPPGVISDAGTRALQQQRGDRV